MRPVWKIIITMSAILLMGFAIMGSTANGKSPTDKLKDSSIIKSIEKETKRSMKKMLQY